MKSSQLPVTEYAPSPYSAFLEDVNLIEELEISSRFWNQNILWTDYRYGKWTIKDIIQHQ
jgi:hypothetical protein